MAAADEGITIPITVTGADAAVADLNKPTQSLRQYIQEAGRFNKAERDRAREIAATARQTQTADAIAKAMTATTGTMTGTMKTSAEASGKMAAALALISSSGGAATGSIGKVAAALGAFSGGPVSMAIAAVGALTAATYSYITAHERQLESLDKEYEARRRLMTVTPLGKFMLDAQLDEEARAEREADRATRLKGARFASGLSAIDRDIAAAEARGQGIGENVSGGSGGRGTPRREMTSAQQGMFEAAMSEGTGGRGPDLDLRSRSSLMQGASAGDVDSFTAALGDSGGLGGKGGVQPMIDNAAAVRDAWTSAFDDIATSGAGAVRALAEGGKEGLASYLSQLGTRMMWEGVDESLKGAFAIATGNVAGGTTMLAIGASHIAEGALLGGVGSAMATPGGGGARPTPGGNGQGGGGDSGPTVINMYSLNPTADAGRSIDKSVRMARRKRA